jgi:hypothetical protein
MDTGRAFKAEFVGSFGQHVAETRPASCRRPPFRPLV